MKNVKSLTPEQLEQLAQRLQDALYLDFVEDEETGEGSFQYDPDKEWDCVDLCSELATIADDFGLRPNKMTPRE